ncbi:MAG: hypothetical protein QM296_09925 [Bacillota bacterium]|nr:hypothetical protein [Bacillota bacterium]
MMTSPWLDTQKIRLLHLIVGAVLCAVALLSLHDLTQTIALLTLALGVATLLRGLSFIALYFQAQEHHLPRTLLLALNGALLALGGLVLIGVALCRHSATVPLRLWLLRVIAVLILLDAAGTLLLGTRRRQHSALRLPRSGLALVLLVLGSSLLLLSFTRPDALAVPLALTLALQGVQHILTGIFLRQR